jgi:hypothetical protein
VVYVGAGGELGGGCVLSQTRGVVYRLATTCGARDACQYSNSAVLTALTRRPVDGVSAVSACQRLSALVSLCRSQRIGSTTLCHTYVGSCESIDYKSLFHTLRVSRVFGQPIRSPCVARGATQSVRRPATTSTYSRTRTRRASREGSRAARTALRDAPSHA